MLPVPTSSSSKSIAKSFSQRQRAYLHGTLPIWIVIQVSTEACLSEVRRMWSLYAQTRTKQEDNETKRDMKSVYDKHITGNGGYSLVLHGVRSAGAHGIREAPLSTKLSTILEDWCRSRQHRDLATLNQDNGGRVNPLMNFSSLGHSMCTPASIPHGLPSSRSFRSPTDHEEDHKLTREPG